MRRLPVENPCSASWEQMIGGERSRRCPSCAQDVHDISAMTEVEATAVLLLFGSEGLCVRYEQDASGEILHAEPKRRPAALTPPRAASGLVAAALGVAACAPSAPVISPPEAPLPARDLPAAAALPRVDPAPSALPPSRGELAFSAVDAAPPAAIPSPPADTDQDGIWDSSDACPTISGKASADPHKNGCPQVVVVVQGGATHSETIRFSHGSRTIPVSSRSVLEAVAEVLLQHPEITRVAVEGHTSSDEPNPKKLGAARAKAVIDALIALKIEPARLVGDAQGSDRPRADNATPSGRTANRRVEFKILERTSCPAPGADGGT
jgi:outer membrane protein OmpA-like peptidoglycan-associated protein